MSLIYHFPTLLNGSRLTGRLVVMAVGLVSLGSCSEEPQPDQETPTSPPRVLRTAAEQEILDEFEAVAVRLERSANPYFGRMRLEQLASQLDSSKAGDAKSANLWLELCFHQVRLDDIAAAKESVEIALRIAEASKNPQLQSVTKKVSVMVSLREAETANCILNHNRECCIFPLAAGGVHRITEPMRKAKAELLALLDGAPADQMLQWLLNIACMALNEYPDGVPERFRIPQDYFQPKLSGEIGEFVDVAPRLGIDTLDLAGGVIISDFDGNGFDDIVTSTSDPRGSLKFFLNKGDGTLEDATAGSGLDVQLGGLNCIGADYDNDSDTDVFVLRGAWLEDDGQIRNSLLRNNGKDPSGRTTFTDVTKASGLAEVAYPTQTAVWADFDNDGDLDLYVGNESRLELRGNGDYPGQLFQNNGSGTFIDVARDAGVTNDRFCKGVTAGDFDNDGDLDLYVSNVGLNRLYRNNGGMMFDDVAEELNIQCIAGYHFAPWFFDFNNDGNLDLFVGAYRASLDDFMADSRGLPHKAVPPNLYLNKGDGTFRDIAVSAGLDHPFLPMGANFGDIDNDSFLDIYLATGESRFEVLTPNVLLRNVNGERFENATFAARLGHLQKGHGVAFADLDHDGDQDLFNQLGGFYPGDKFHNALFLNPGNGNRYLAIQCVGTTSNRDGIGARIAVSIVDADGKTRSIHRAVGAVSSFGGSPLRQEIGLGSAKQILNVTVTWPTSATTQAYADVPLDSAIKITEGEAVFQLLKRKPISF
ncbi:MAG: CRTAC1 family protein [Verrucomicrobia bacterium]|nr:CRTAC1 family protein [Verrucomicrobiota bacterium]